MVHRRRRGRASGRCSATSTSSTSSRSRPSATATGSQGTILGPFHLPDAPLLDAPFELPHRPDEPGDRTRVSGRVTDADGKPLADANLDIWQADAEGRYSGFMPGPPEGNLRGQVRTDADGRYESITVIPGPYTIPLDGPTGKMTAAAGWSPWRPAHIHLIVSAEGHEPLVTQLFIDSSDYLDNDVASAVKPELIVHPEPPRRRRARASPTTSRCRRSWRRRRSEPVPAAGAHSNTENDGVSAGPARARDRRRARVPRLLEADRGSTSSRRRGAARGQVEPVHVAALARLVTTARPAPTAARSGSASTPHRRGRAHRAEVDVDPHRGPLARAGRDRRRREHRARDGDARERGEQARACRPGRTPP